jgi:hypothetical protein
VIAMKNPDLNPQSVLQNRWSRRARLQALLFHGAAVGTALLMICVDVPKRPSGCGE